MAPECSMTEPPQAFLTLLLSSPLTRAVEQIDPRLGPALLGQLGHRIGERALEPHELGPIDRQRERLRPHSPGPSWGCSPSTLTFRGRDVSRPPQPSTPLAGSVTPRPTPIAPPSFVSLPIGGAR